MASYLRVVQSLTSWLMLVLFLRALPVLVESFSSFQSSTLDHYKVLGVANFATTKEIKKAYRKKALETHPDKNNDIPQATMEFRKVANSYEVLSNTLSRNRYDNKRRKEEQFIWEKRMEVLLCAPVLQFGCLLTAWLWLAYLSRDIAASSSEKAESLRNTIRSPADFSGSMQATDSVRRHHYAITIAATPATTVHQSENTAIENPAARAEKEVAEPAARVPKTIQNTAAFRPSMQTLSSVRLHQDTNNAMVATTATTARSENVVISTLAVRSAEEVTEPTASTRELGSNGDEERLVVPPALTTVTARSFQRARSASTAAPTRTEHDILRSRENFAPAPVAAPECFAKRARTSTTLVPSKKRKRDELPTAKRICTQSRAKSFQVGNGQNDMDLTE